MQQHWKSMITKLTKICTKCNIKKPLTEFANNKGGSLGKHSRCRLCRNKLSRIRRRNANPEQIRKRKKYQREWRRKFRKENFEYCKNYYLKNKKKIRIHAVRLCKKKKRRWLKYLPKNHVITIQSRQSFFILNNIKLAACRKFFRVIISTNTNCSINMLYTVSKFWF